MRMRAAKLVAPKKIEVVEIPFEPNPSPREVVVQVKAVGICGTDLHVFQGERKDVELPRVMGHELSGIVTCVGKDVTDFSEGDRVVLDPVFACGECRACRKGHPNVCAKVCCFGVQMEGGFQDYISVPAHRLYKFPDQISMVDAALAEPFSVAANIVTRMAADAGETAVVIGAGTIGLAVTQALVGIGAKVLVSDIAEEKLQMAKAFGACQTVNSKKEDLAAAVELFTPGGADILVDAVGITPLTELTLALAAPAARVAVIGFDEKTMQVSPVSITKRELTIVGSRMNNGQFLKVIRWLDEGKIDPHAMITGVYPLEEIEQAFEATLAHPETCVKTIITF